MAYTVYDEGDWSSNQTGSINPGGSITALGLYRLWVDTSHLQIQDGAGSTIDKLRVGAQVRVNSGEPLRDAMATAYVFAGAQTWRSPDIECGAELVFTITGYIIRTSGTSIPWKIFRAS